MLVSEATCPADPAPGQQTERQVNPANPDNRLLTEALQRIVNHERCRQGLKPLALSQAAVQAAAGQARSMAKHDFIGHHSPLKGHETLERRLNVENVGYRRAAENVARFATTMLSPREGVCLGQAAAPNATYGELAQGLFDVWMGSSSHRVNMLGRDFRALGAGIGVTPHKYRCGEVAAAMVVTG